MLRANVTTVNLMNFKLFSILSLASRRLWCSRNVFQMQNWIPGMLMAGIFKVMCYYHYKIKGTRENIGIIRLLSHYMLNGTFHSPNVLFQNLGNKSMNAGIERLVINYENISFLLPFWNWRCWTIFSLFTKFNKLCKCGVSLPTRLLFCHLFNIPTDYQNCDWDNIPTL